MLCAQRTTPRVVSVSGGGGADLRASDSEKNTESESNFCSKWPSPPLSRVNLSFARSISHSLLSLARLLAASSAAAATAATDIHHW